MKYVIRSLTIILAISFAASFAGMSGASGAPAKHREAAKAGGSPAEPIKEISSVDSLSRWMTYYYANPQPELLVPALLFADKEGLLKGDTVAPLQAFAARVMAQNPGKVKEWFTKLGPMSEIGKTVVLTSIWWSNTKEGKELLDTVASGLTEKSKSEFREQVNSAPPTVETMEISSPDILDMLWASFSATGDTKYVTRLMTVLPWGRPDAKDLPKMLIASAARWSLISNINQHARVKECCESTLNTNSDLKPYLEKVLAEAAAAAGADKEKQSGRGKSAGKEKQSDKD
jgi:hypothetical protein